MSAVSLHRRKDLHVFELRLHLIYSQQRLEIFESGGFDDLEAPALGSKTQNIHFLMYLER